MQVGPTPALTKPRISKKKKNSTMNIKQEGTIISKSENGDYGFIDHRGGEKIFFHARRTIEHLEVDDRVLFEAGDSKRQPGKLEAFYVRKAYSQPNGFDLALGRNLRATPEALEALGELLEREIRIETQSQDEIVITKELPDRAGHSLAIETTNVTKFSLNHGRAEKDIIGSLTIKNQEKQTDLP